MQPINLSNFDFSWDIDPQMVSNEPVSFVHRNLQNRNLCVPLTGIGTQGLNKLQIIVAIHKNFRLIDTTKENGNEKLVGEAILESGANPNHLCIITKLDRKSIATRRALRMAIEESTSHLCKIPDFFLVDGPYPDLPMISVFRELEILKKEGKVKEYGVSNFSLDQILFLINNGYRPALNQIEYHPYFQPYRLAEFCHGYDIILQACQPLAQGAACTDPTIIKIANELKLSPAEVIYTWLAQHKIAMVINTESDVYQNEFAYSGRAKLTSEQMEAINILQKGETGRTLVKEEWSQTFTNKTRELWSGAIRAKL